MVHHPHKRGGMRYETDSTRVSMYLPHLYQQFIRRIGDGTGAPDSLLHVHAGMAILFVARKVTRRSLAMPVPFAVDCLAELANEAMDRLNYRSWRWEDTSLDILNTLFWPSILMIGLRWRRAHPLPGN
jgi:hypothetical protein